MRTYNICFYGEIRKKNTTFFRSKNVALSGAVLLYGILCVIILTCEKKCTGHAVSLIVLLFFIFITKTYLYNFDPLNPHFYTVKWGVYRGIHYFSYFCPKT